MPRVSVVIPMYNAERHISRALGSVLRQTVADHEVIVVDDGSRDGGAAAVERVGDRRVRLVRQPNGGDAAARNAGVRAAASPLVALLDADDEWRPEFLAAVLGLAARFPEAGLYATGYRRTYHGGFAIDVSVAAEGAADGQLLVRDYFCRAREHAFVTSSSVAVPRRIFVEVGEFAGPVGAGSDRDMWARIALRHPVACDTRILAVYHGEHVSGRVSGRPKLRPRFAETARVALESGTLAPPLAAEVREYVHCLWVPLVHRAIADGNVREARRILSEELRDTRVYRSFVRRMRLVLLLLPARPAALLCRFGLSRWWLRSAGRLRTSRGVLLLPG